MANLTSTRETFQKLIIPLVFVIIAAILISLIFFRYKSKTVHIPAQSPPPSPPVIKQDPKQKQPLTLDFSKLSKKEFPKTLPVYTLEKYQDLSSDNAQQVANSLSFTDPPSLVDKNTSDGIQYTWQKGETNLTLSRSSLRYKTPMVDKNTILLTENQLQDIAKEFIARIPTAQKDLEIDSQKTTYLKKGQALPTTTNSFENADLVSLYFQKSIEGFHLLPSDPSSPTAFLTIQKNGNIITLNLRLYKQFTKGNSYKLRSLDDAVLLLKQGKGKVAQTLLLDENGKAIENFRTQPQDIKNLTVTAVDITYFLPEENTTIQPIYVFIGEFTKENQKGRTVIYLPAIDNAIKP